ncbi:TonB-dependent siderophore receptor [Methylocystis sp. SC2]|uniref:TonB-dependent receptor n=1 Tax=Methylocystis sp. (strain SC2) TaxID=187303 RepID=UPI00027AE780|nr:TonB-dependent receptor [Methylocystis sp. SC2]CCJ07910.1 TonB-dependent receptor [Methylocystis sp. SC2]
MRTTALVALLCLCVGAAQARAEALREDEGKETLQSAGKRRGKEKSGAKEQNKETNTERSQVERRADAPNAQTLGRDQSGVYVNAPAANSAYSPGFVMRGFPAGVTLFDGAAHGFTAQDVDLSTVDHVEFYKGPSAMLFGKALGGYGGAANYIRKAPTQETFAHAVATKASFAVTRFTADVNTPLNDDKSLLFRMTGSAQSLGSFVDFTRTRSFDIAPMLAFTADNGDRVSLRAEHNGARLVWRDGVPAEPIFLHIPREFYAGLPANEHETPFFDDFTLRYEHAFNADWKIAAVVDYFLYATRWGWFTGWGYDGFQSVVFGNPVRARTANRSFDAQLRLNGRFDTSFLSHTVFLGLEQWDFYFGYNNDIARYEAAPLNIFAPIYSPGVSYAGAFWSNGVARAISRSVYGQDLIDLNENWRILIGGRYDLLAQRERVFDPFGALTVEPTSSLSKGTEGYFSPRAGILYRPDEETQLFAAYGKSLIPNTGVRIQSGEAPPPQQDTQYEIGFRREFLDRKMSFEVGLFDITRDDVAIPNPANPSGFYSVVTGQQHSHGIEVNLGGEILPNLKINAVATFLHALVSKDDNIPSQQGSDLLGAPRRVYNFSANYAFNTGDLKGLELGVSYYYASRLEATLPNTYGFTLAPQQMLGASLGYALNDNLKLEINAANLTNQSNWTSNGALYHGEPRTIAASLSYKY